MMGRLNHDQEQFFYSICLDEAVPDDHPVREIAAVLDLSSVHSELAPDYPRLGRPSIDPVLMIRMLIVGYVFGIRSERALCRDVRVNLAYRWFCGLSIEDKVPDHSAFSRARNERFRDSGIFRSVFERVVGACIGVGLVGGEGFAVDASLIVADANKQRSTPGPQWTRDLDAEAVSRATKEYLARLDDAAFGAASDVTPKFVSPSDPAAHPRDVVVIHRSELTTHFCFFKGNGFSSKVELSAKSRLRDHFSGAWAPAKKNVSAASVIGI
jgi:transposase